VSSREEWQAETLLEENRRLLRGLSGLRPPDDLRRAVLTAAEESEAAAQTVGPLILPFLIMPAILAVWVALVVFGMAAWIGLVAVLLGIAAVSAAGEADRGMVEHSADVEPLGAALAHLARGVALDVAGIAAGAVLLLALVVALFYAAG
jgi:hypothetical protein